MSKSPDCTKLFYRIFFLLLPMCFIISACSASKNPSSSQGSTDPIDSLFQPFHVPNPGISCAVIKDGKIVLEKNYGYADVENKVITSSATNYRIASLSKQFTAAAIMKLVHQKKLTYETTLSQIFPGFPEYGETITIRHLLTHRSGIIGYGDFVLKNEQILDERILEELMKVNSIYFHPNEKFMYSNSGYAVLAQVVEKVAKKPFAEFMKLEIFKSANMTSTSLYEVDKNIANRAYGYTIEENSAMKTDHNETSAVKGDGSIYSSINDLFAWDQALYTDEIMPQEILQEAFYGYDESGKTDKKGYGFGWMVNYSNELKVVEHTGSSIGFTHHIIRVPELNLSVIVLTNRHQNYYDNGSFTNIGYSLINKFSDGAVFLK